LPYSLFTSLWQKHDMITEETSNRPVRGFSPSCQENQGDTIDRGIWR
jgi:hypothetical protein